MSFTESIFLTGFPGFIAGRLVEKLARPETQFFILVQPQFMDKAMQQLQAIADKTGTPPENFALIEGDITRENLGIDTEDLATLRDEVTDIFHLAAVYDLAVEKTIAYQVNLHGTRNINGFAKTVRTLNRYNYVSTCYVAGKRKGEIRESDLKHDAGFRNFYEETKYLAEIEVEDLKEILPVSIYRPSVVVGDSLTGETAKFDGIYYLIDYLKKAPSLLRLLNVGNDVVKLNLVPVDFVVDAIAALARDDRSVGRTMALADPKPLTTGELFDAISEKMTGKRSVIKPPAAMIEWSLNLNVSPGLTGLPHAAVPYFFIAQTYDTDQAQRLLVDHGIDCPDFRTYVGNLLTFADKNRQL